MQPIKIQKNDLKAQVKEALNDYIKQMDLSKSNKLPREEALADMLGVSRVTLRSVLDEMSSDGIIFKRQGKGTFVNTVFFEMNVSFNPVMHFSDMIRNSGYEPKVDILHCGVEPANSEISNKLKIQEGKPVIVCAKVFYADNNICAMVQDYVPEEIVGALDLELMKLYGDSLFYYIYHQTKRRIIWDKVEIDVVDSKEVKRLHDYMKEHGGNDRPFLLLSGINYDEEDKEILYAKEYIDTSILKFNQIRKRSISYDV